MTGQDLDTIGERIEMLLDALADADPAARETAEDLVHTLLEFYGAGLGRIVELTRETGDGLLERLTADPIVKGLLVMHDLHPEDTLHRVTAALDEVRPYLGSHAGDVELVGIDEQGVLRLQLTGTCDGCPSSTVTVKYAIEKAIQDAAPEITGIDVQGVVPEPDQMTVDGRQLLPLTALECPVPEPR